MSDLAIRAENLAKKYSISKVNSRNDTLRDLITDSLGSLFRHTVQPSLAETTFWALKDVSFEVKQGELIGIVGKNGAGKSTLLKILSQIVTPTHGWAQLYGRLGSLLEVGTGFHPELTGRENIYLNGAVIGMKKEEIRRRFDEIVDFSEIGEFLDVPVKRYSSGMYVRLAFAVAAHLEPDILLVDEVLAVGDAAFQKKCLGKIGAVAKGGRTVLFISHNMTAINSLCERVLWVREGQIVEDGPSVPTVSKYLAASLEVSESEEIWNSIDEAPGNDVVRLHSIRVRRLDGASSDPITMQTPFEIEVKYWNLVEGARLYISLVPFTDEGVPAFSTDGFDTVWGDRPMPAGLFRSSCIIPGDLLNSGIYRFAVLVVKDRSSVIYRYEKGVSVVVHDLKKRKGSWHGKHLGVVQPLLHWNAEFVDKIEAHAGQAASVQTRFGCN